MVGDKLRFEICNNYWESLWGLHRERKPQGKRTLRYDMMTIKFFFFFFFSNNPTGCKNNIFNPFGLSFLQPQLFLVFIFVRNLLCMCENKKTLEPFFKPSPSPFSLNFFSFHISFSLLYHKNNLHVFFATFILSDFSWEHWWKKHRKA